MDDNTNFDELFQPKERKPRAKKAASDAVEKIAAIADQPAHQKTTGWSNEDIETIGMAISLLLLEGSRFISYRLVETDELKMEQDEIDVMAKAISRIALRHIKIAKGKRGDVTDGAALMLAVVTYSMRTYEQYGRIQRTKNQTNSTNRSSPELSQNYR